MTDTPTPGTGESAQDVMDAARAYQKDRQGQGTFGGEPLYDAASLRAAFRHGFDWGNRPEPIAAAGESAALDEADGTAAHIALVEFHKDGGKSLEAIEQELAPAREQIVYPGRGFAERWPLTLAAHRTRAEPAEAKLAEVTRERDDYESKVISLFCDVQKLRERVAALQTAEARIAELEAVLTDIAAFGDEGANAYLKARGSYGGFDEPAAVQAARAALKGRA